jgi:hypothetical protein
MTGKIKTESSVFAPRDPHYSAKKRDLVRHLAMACERAKMPEIKVFSMDFAI